MIALQDRPSFPILLNVIKETFTTIDKFEWQGYDELRTMRDEQIYKEGGHSSFQEFCESELFQFGGYRRINQLILAKEVSNALKGTELEGVVTNERQARPVARLLKFPDKAEKIRQVAAIAKQNTEHPTSQDFAKAVLKVVPQKQKSSIPQNTKKVQEPRFLKGVKVRVSSKNHPRYGEDGQISGDPPNLHQQFVEFSNGREAIFTRDLSIIDAPVERKLPPEYMEAIAQLEQQHREEMSRLENELRIGLLSEAQLVAAQSVKEQLEAAQAIAFKVKEENVVLQEQLHELESLRRLEIENQAIKQENEQLRNQLQLQPMQRWDMSRAVVERLDKNTQAAIKNTIDLRSLAAESPKEDAKECLRLMGMALGNLARALNDTSALTAAAIILKCEPTESAIASSIERSHLVEQAVVDIRRQMAIPGGSWEELYKIASEYEQIKHEYWSRLTTAERKSILELKNSFNAKEPGFPELSPIQVGVTVSHADKYSVFYNKKGRVFEEIGEEVTVVWDEDEEQRPKRYFKTDLRLMQTLLLEV